jgi:hypothetical protein
MEKKKTRDSGEPPGGVAVQGVGIRRPEATSSHGRSLALCGSCLARRFSIPKCTDERRRALRRNGIA